MALWRASAVLFWATVAAFTILYATQILPIQAGSVHVSWGSMEPGITLPLATFAGAGLSGLALVLGAGAFDARPTLRSPGRARLLAAMLAGVVAFGGWAAYLIRH